MQQVNLNNIDKTNWKTYRFDEIIKNISERVDPHNTDLELYIGLEHLDPDSIHIKRSGTKDDVKGQKLKCYPGDIIFGKRRAYQRKAAVITKEGICSAHAFVLRANPKVIAPELLPFFIHSDLFMHRSVDISVGGLSPTINWGTLKSQEFLLPPKEQQAQFAELLWSMDEVIEKELMVKTTVINHFESSRDAIFSTDLAEHPLCISNDSNYQENNFDAYMKTKMLNGIYKSKEYQGKGIRLINMGELFAYPIIKEEKMSLLDLNNKEKQRFIVEEGDLIFARRSLVVEGAGKCSIIGKHSSPMAFESSMIRARVNRDIINPKYIYHFLKSKEGKKRIRRIVGFTTVAGIASTDLAKVKIPQVASKRQNAIIEYLDQFDDAFLSINERINASKSLQKSLINQVF